MEENKYYVYMHIKETTGEPFYVGKGFGRRYKQTSGRSSAWTRTYKKYGFDTIFLEIDLTEKECFDKETYWINRIGRRCLNQGPLVNHTDGGGGISGYRHTEETKKKISEVQIGFKHSEETKSKIGSGNSGKVRTQDVKDRISNTLLGNIPWNKNKKGLQEGCNKKIVLDTQTGIYYDSIHEAYTLTPYSRPYLSMMLSGKKKNKTAFIYA